MSKDDPGKDAKDLKYTISRRQFIQFSGGAVAAGVLTNNGIGWISKAKADTEAEEGQGLAPNEPLPETEIKKSVCHQCPAACGIDVYVTDGKVHRILGNPEHPISNGKLCPKGYFGFQILYDPDRFKGPLKRTNPAKGRDVDPGFVEITWDEALDTVAGRLELLRNKNESHRFALLTGRVWGASDGEIIEAFGKLYGSPNVPISNNSLGCEASKRARLATDGNDSHIAHDYDNCNHILSFGAGLLESYLPYNYTLQKWGVMREKAPRTTVTAVDIRMSTTAVASDRSLMIKPGTDGALALAIAHVIMTEGLWDRKFVGDFVNGVNIFESGEDVDASHFVERQVSGLVDWWNGELKNRTPEWASNVCRVSPEVIIDVAREFATVRPSMALIGRGATAHTNGFYNGMAIHSLNALTGSLFAKGGVMYQMEPPYGPLPANKDDYLDHYASSFWKKKVPRIDLAGSKDFPLTHTMMQNVAKNHMDGKPYKLDTVMCYLSNPLFSTPDCTQWEEALKDIFVIDTSPFPGETAMYADIILPDHTYLERYQDTPIVPTYGFPTTGLRTPVIEEPLHNTKGFSDTLIEIGKRLGGKTSEYYEQLDSTENVLEHLAKGFEENEGDNDVYDFDSWAEEGVWYKKPYLWRQVNGEFYEWDGTGYNKRMSDADVKKSLMRTPSGKFEFKSSLLERNANYINKQLEMPKDKVAFPQWVNPGYTGGGDLHLIAPKYAFHAGGRGANIPMSIEQFQPYVGGRKGTFLEMHPETAKARGISHNDRVRIATSLGAIEGAVRYYVGCQEDVVVLPFEFGHWAMGRWAKDRGTGNSNEIIANVAEPISGLVAYNATLCKIERIS